MFTSEQCAEFAAEMKRIRTYVRSMAEACRRFPRRDGVISPGNACTYSIASIRKRGRQPSGACLIMKTRNIMDRKRMPWNGVKLYAASFDSQRGKIGKILIMNPRIRRIQNLVNELRGGVAKHQGNHGYLAAQRYHVQWYQVRFCPHIWKRAASPPASGAVAPVAKAHPRSRKRLLADRERRAKQPFQAEGARPELRMRHEFLPKDRSRTYSVTDTLVFEWWARLQASSTSRRLTRTTMMRILSFNRWLLRSALAIDGRLWSLLPLRKHISSPDVWSRPVSFQDRT